MRRRPTSKAPRTLILALSVALAGTVAAAEVRIKTLADGTRVIYNESADQRARRQADRLLSVPSAELEALIDRYARRRGMSPELVQAVIQVESGYNANALSSKGAMGLMQLMPATAQELGVTDPYDPEESIRGGTLYLRRLLVRYGDLRKALAAYNAGPSAVDRHAGIPPYRETEHYVRKILGVYRGTAVPPQLLQEHARSQALQRERERKPAPRSGEKVYVVRDEDGNIVMTTSPKN